MPNEESNGKAENASTDNENEEANGNANGPNNDRELRRGILRFARRTLFLIAVLAVAAAVPYMLYGGESAAEEVFEFVKVGLLPLAVMVLTYYFAKPGGAEPGGGSEQDDGKQGPVNTGGARQSQ